MKDFITVHDTLPLNTKAPIAVRESLPLNEVFTCRDEDSTAHWLTRSGLGIIRRRVRVVVRGHCYFIRHIMLYIPLDLAEDKVTVLV